MQLLIEADIATLTNVNLGNEGAKSDPTSRVDLDFDCEAGAAVLATLLGIENVKEFWDESENAYAKLLGVEKVVSKAVMQHATMTFGDLTVEDCTVKKFSCKPLNGRRVSFHCQVQVRHTPDQLTMIDSMQLSEHALRLETKSGDLFD